MDETKEIKINIPEGYEIDKEPTISSDWIGYVSENGIQPILDCETNEFL